MTPKPFTEEQITVLRENPNTEYVSESVIKFTQEFKVKLVEGIKKGVKRTKMYPVKWTHELATNPNCVHLKR